jgi:hypothetical protein
MWMRRKHKRKKRRGGSSRRKGERGKSRRKKKKKRWKNRKKKKRKQTKKKKKKKRKKKKKKKLLAECLLPPLFLAPVPIAQSVQRPGCAGWTTRARCQRFSPEIQTNCEVHQASQTMGTGIQL